ncbi:hypothetical protein ARMSODRAFT_493901 [Armillaria solidipes]|uniref:Uncharacterized protein n=1 Tax=Armillaria solidipes TaxID=1076256 RepID=A0A2H3C0P9_9AGAR|nr:hypothetical protein ARMSODRAFT_493901 [Armillaria solidipes]
MAESRRTERAGRTWESSKPKRRTFLIGCGGTTTTLDRDYTMNRGPIVLTIDEAEYLLDQLPPPSSDDEQFVVKLRRRLQDLLADLRAGAEGTGSHYL